MPTPSMADGTDSDLSSVNAPLSLVASPALTIPLPEESPLFVGRRQELERLHEYLETALSGHGQVVFVTGEAGAGKTALVSEFVRNAQKTYPELLVVYGNCNAQTGISDPYLPFRELLQSLVGDVTFASVAAQVVVEQAPDLIDTLVSSGELSVHISNQDAEKPVWLAELEQIVTRRGRQASASGLNQSRIFEQVTAVLQTLAAHRPLLLVLDDLHWVDTASASLFFHLVRRIGESRLLLVGTYRPEDVTLIRDEEQHPLQIVAAEVKRQQGDIWIALNQLSRADLRDFVDRLIDSEPNRLDESFRQALFRHTGGQALFTVEMLRALQEQGDLRQDVGGFWVEGKLLDWNALPAKIEGVIEKRIVRLDVDLQDALTIASVQGEEFIVEAVAQVQNKNERSLMRQLSNELERRHRLVTAQGMTRAGKRRISRFRFRHNLFQTYLYGQLNEIERTYLHEEVGIALEALYADRTDVIAVQLAWHLQQAGLFARAVPYLLTAGLSAHSSSAQQEAIVLFNQGLDLLKHVSNPVERLDLELQLQIGLSEALITTHGYASPMVEDAWLRVSALCRQSGDKTRLGRALWWLSSTYGLQGKLREAQHMAEQALEVGQETNDQQLTAQAYHAMSNITRAFGKFGKSREYMAQALARVDRIRPVADNEGVGRASQVLLNAGSLLLVCGYPEQALDRLHESIHKMTESEDLFDYVAINMGAADFYLRIRQPKVAQPLVEKALAVAHEYGYTDFAAYGTYVKGAVLVQQGLVEEGMALLQQGLTTLRTLNKKSGELRILYAQAQGFEKLGQPAKGIQLLEQIVIAAETGERNLEAEAHRLYGELLHMQNAPGSTIEERFQRAIDIARRQEGKLFELRATACLTRLWQKQGKIDEAHQMLAEIYGWFTEGFDTVDLQEAKALLNELSNSAPYA